MTAQEAALKGVANSKLSRLLALNKTSDCTGVKIGDSLLLNKAPNWASALKWGRPARVPDIGETGATVKY